MIQPDQFTDTMHLMLAVSGAAWCAALVRLDETGFEPEGSWGSLLPDSVNSLLLDREVQAWLEASLPSGRARTRSVRRTWENLHCTHLSAIPQAGEKRLFLVGTNRPLEKRHRVIFRDLLAGFRPDAADSNGQHSSRQKALKSLDDPARLDLLRVLEQLGSLEITELDLEGVLRRSVERSRKMIGGCGAELGLVDQRNNSVRVLWSDLPARSNGPYSVPFGKDVIGRIAVSGVPLWINDYNAWEHRTVDAAPFYSVIGVPLKYKGEVIGTLTVVDDQPDRQFDEGDAQLLEFLGSQIAISIRNARLFQELGERIKSQRAAEGKLIEAARLAAIGEMAASVAHELNNPLTSIAGFSELLLDEFPKGSPQQENMALVLSEARRAREVVRRLLDFSRREETLKVSLNINEVVSEVLALAQPLALTQSIEIHFEAWEDLPPVFGDRSQLRQVLLNLVTNGIQAMKHGGQLLVQSMLSDQPNPRVAINVRDRGVGIPTDYQARIFEPFFTTKPVGSGTGLGLSISKNIIMDHGGEITFDSVEGEGTCFTVLLPVLVEPVVEGKP